MPLEPWVYDDGEPFVVGDVWFHPLQELSLALWAVPVNGTPAGDELVEEHTVAPYVALRGELVNL